MKIPNNIAQKFGLLNLKPQYLLILIALFIWPLWVLEWGPLEVKHSLETNIDLIGRLPESLDVSKQPSRTLNKATSHPNTLNKTPSAQIIKKVVVIAGDTLMTIFTRMGLSQSLSFRAIKSLSEKYDSKNIIPGQELEFVFKPALPFDQREKSNVIGKLRKVIFQPNL